MTDSISGRLITIDPSFKARRSLTLSQNIANGSVSWTVSDSAGNISENRSYAYRYNDVALTAVPNEGYRFTGWDVRDANGSSIKVTNNKFTMQDANVEIKAIFEEIPTQPKDPTDPTTDPAGPAAEPGDDGNLCKWDNVDHGSSFRGMLVHFFPRDPLLLRTPVRY